MSRERFRRLSAVPGMTRQPTCSSGCITGIRSPSIRPALDHTPSDEAVPHSFGEQIGPGRSSRAMAIVHVAIFEAMNAIDRHFDSYAGHAARGLAGLAGCGNRAGGA